MRFGSGLGNGNDNGARCSDCAVSTPRARQPPVAAHRPSTAAQSGRRPMQPPAGARSPRWTGRPGDSPPGPCERAAAPSAADETDREPAFRDSWPPSSGMDPPAALLGRQRGQQPTAWHHHGGGILERQWRELVVSAGIRWLRCSRRLRPLRQQRTLATAKRPDVYAAGQFRYPAVRSAHSLTDTTSS